MKTKPEPVVTADLLAAVIRGDDLDAEVLARIAPAEFCDQAEQHGVLPLVAGRLARTSASPELRAIVERQAADHVAADLLRERELRQLVSALDERNVPALLMKGSHLAYSYYPRPDLRVRTDTDVFVRESDRARADAALVSLGYVFTQSMSGDLVMPQRTYVKEQLGVIGHAVDLHWRIANPLMFGGMLTFDELWADAVALPKLGPSARGLSSIHALVLACVHRVAHHADSDCLVWLYDIHLVVPALRGREWSAFVELAADRGVAGICRVSLTRAIDRFGTHVPREVLDQLERVAQENGESTSAYLRGRSRMATFFDDFRVLGSWSARLRLVREHLFPPPVYMRDVYAPSSAAPLPYLYAQRVARGARKWLSRP